MSYAIDGVIVEADEFERRQSLGDGGYFKKPWKDIGYHYIAEYANGNPIITEGRSEDTDGAHEYRKMPDMNGHLVSMNKQSISICIVGNFDKEEPGDDILNVVAEKIADITKKYSIRIYRVIGHNDITGVTKSCPGKNVNLHKLRKKVIKVLVDRLVAKGG